MRRWGACSLVRLESFCEREGRTIFYTGDVHFDDQTIIAIGDFPQSDIDV